jgi:hypothetical protein
MGPTSADGVELPPFPTDNAIELVSVKDSKIISISVHSGRAEITRVFKFTVKSGLNQVAILGLPHALDKDSLRCVCFWMRVCSTYDLAEQSRRSRHRDYS